MRIIIIIIIIVVVIIILLSLCQRDPGNSRKSSSVLQRGEMFLEMSKFYDFYVYLLNSLRSLAARDTVLPLLS
jgi:hypothetical protein